MIRRAVPPDAAALARFAERTFREAFAAQNTPENMDLHCAATYGEAIQGREIVDPHIETVLYHDAGDLLGYGQLRWGPAPPCVAAALPAEVQRLYVDPHWRGRGVARTLMAELLARAARGGADQVWLGVWERNPRAIAFYGKHGFVEVGAQVFQLGGDPQRDLVFVRVPLR